MEPNLLSFFNFLKWLRKNRKVDEIFLGVLQMTTQHVKKLKKKNHRNCIPIAPNSQKFDSDEDQLQWT